MLATAGVGAALLAVQQMLWASHSAGTRALGPPPQETIPQVDVQSTDLLYYIIGLVDKKRCIRSDQPLTSHKSQRKWKVVIIPITVLSAETRCLAMCAHTNRCLI
jgi:hypothetical protein